LVDNDNIGGSVLATEHLMSLGRKKIVSVTGTVDEFSSIDRVEGWRSAVGADEAMTALMSESGNYNRQGGKTAMAALLQRVPDLDAVFVASDLMAAGALDALREAGKRVPEDVAVVGFDDHPLIAPHTDPPLTTIKQDTNDQVAHMVTHLLRLLRDEPVRARREVLPTVLVRRESA
jgi:DNA-binding LacI/PurR family transcriptional regulator